MLGIAERLEGGVEGFFIHFPPTTALLDLHAVNQRDFGQLSRLLGAEYLPSEASLKPAGEVADVVAVRMGEDDAGKLVRVAVDGQIPGRGQLFVIVFSLVAPQSTA